MSFYGGAAMRPHDGSYRPDIDGLRALAILLVVAFHVAPQRLPGGFVGVDVFFVISGYLITAIIGRELIGGQIDYWRFYARRIRRIFPALILVLSATLGLGWIALMPDEYAALGKHVVGGAAFIDNLLLWNEAGYFDVIDELKPLAHLWSLGVEEQFYLIWPITLALVWKAGTRAWALVAGLAALSCAANILLAGHYPDGVFYFPLTRLWEMLVGALLALGGAHRMAQTPMAVRQALSVVGLSLIVAAVLLFDRSAPYPTWRALLPVFGTAALIAAGADTFINRRLLGNRVGVGLGLISYPLYLWHWPLLSLVIIYMPEGLYSLVPGAPVLLAAKLAAVGAALVAAIATYRLVELPIRRFDLTRTALWLCLGMVVVGAVGAAIYLADGVKSRWSRADAALLDNLRQEEAQAISAYRDRACFLRPEQGAEAFAAECRGAAAPHVLLWGDSYGAHIYPGLAGWAVRTGVSVSQYTASACPPLAGYETPRRRLCAAINDRVVAEIASQRPRILLLSANWQGYWADPGFFERLKATLDIVRPSVGRIVIVGPVVAFPAPQVKLALRARKDAPRNPQLPELRRLDAALKNFAAVEKLGYVSPIASLCEADSCDVFLSAAGSRAPFAWDVGHLTRAGSIYYVDHLIAPILQVSPNE